jgi:multidrug efflux pump subunit AcrA (membrane-fusion protein)
MTTFSLLPLTIVALLAQLGSETPVPSSEASDPVIPDAVVRVADSIKLAAKEPGVINHLAVKEGTVVQAGQKIGQIDDSKPQLQKKAATYAMNGALKRAKDDVEIRFSTAQSLVSEANYDEMVEANRLAKGAITDVDVRRAKLDWDRSELAIEKARHEQDLAKYEYFTKKAELEGAELAIKDRVITAPFDGIVERLARKQEEWVNPGDVILQLLRLDTMEVEGAVDQSQYDAHELQNCEVTVEVQLARGRKETFRGRLTKISAVVGGTGMYAVRAEVPNRPESGSWMLRDGLMARMTIHLGTGGTAATAGGRRIP